MRGEKVKRRERNRSDEGVPHTDVREKVLDELKNLYVQDKISLEQYEIFAAEIQKAVDPQAVLRSALTVYQSSDTYGKAEGCEVNHDHVRRASSLRISRFRARFLFAFWAGGNIRRLFSMRHGGT